MGETKKTKTTKSSKVQKEVKTKEIKKPTTASSKKTEKKVIKTIEPKKIIKITAQKKDKKITEKKIQASNSKVKQEGKKENNKIEIKKEEKQSVPTNKKEENVLDIKSKEIKKELPNKVEKKESAVNNFITKGIKSKKDFKLIDVIIVSVITMCIGLFVGSIFLREKKNLTLEITGNKYLDEFLSVVDTIKANSYPTVSDEELFTAATQGMLNGMKDSYSEYFNTTETNNFEIKMKGSYVGIGCEIASYTDGSGVTVVSVYENTPAERAGLQSGDIIKEIDDKDALNWTSDEMSKYIRTNDVAGTNIKLKVDRNGQEVMINLKRELVTLTSVTGEVIEKDNQKIGYMKITVFASNTYEQFNEVLKDLESKKIDSLIMDVRDNSGGYLSIATSIISKFIPSNKVIYKLQDNSGIKDIYSSSLEKKNYNIAVLVNENSASASEILATALKESYGATVIGRNTYGKDSVQEASKLSSGNIIKYTIQTWLTPFGNSVANGGYTPDVIVTDDNLMIDQAVQTLIKK